MVRNGKRNIEHRSKVKTGCITCRIRRIKCDEGKPSCHKCISTGRICDGYESLFREQLINSADADKSNIITQLAQSEITLEDIELLNRCLSTKTIFDGVKLECSEEAEQLLQASLTNPHVKHAVLSLRALRSDHGMLQNGFPFVMQQDPGYTYGTQQYSMALKGLASNLSSLSFQDARSALLCCQIFISIEQVQANYSAMAQHMIGGLRIMHEYQRIQYADKNRLNLEKDEQLPLLDVFLIKLFVAPCKFKDPPSKYGEYEATVQVEANQQSLEKPHIFMLKPDMRTELTKLGRLALHLLPKASQVNAADDISRLVHEKTSILDALESWLTSLDSCWENSAHPDFEPVSISFLRLFHIVLKVVLLGVLDFSVDLHDKLKLENDQLQMVANLVSEKVRSYRI